MIHLCFSLTPDSLNVQWCVWMRITVATFTLFSSPLVGKLFVLNLRNRCTEWDGTMWQLSKSGKSCLMNAKKHIRKKRRRRLKTINKYCCSCSKINGLQNHKLLSQTWKCPSQTQFHTELYISNIIKNCWKSTSSIDSTEYIWWDHRVSKIWRYHCGRITRAKDARNEIFGYWYTIFICHFSTLLNKSFYF